MSKTSSGLFSGTKGSKASYNSRTSQSTAQIKATSHERIKSWAKQKQNELTGKAKKNFNTACVVYDDETGKFYYGRNGGYREEGYVQNPVLFGDSTHDGADVNHLHITTIHTTKSQFGKYKESCENCKAAFKGKVKANYSGWKDED